MDRIDGFPQADKQPLEVIFPGYLDLAALHRDIIDREFFGGDEALQVEPECTDVGGEFSLGFFKAHEYAWLVEFQRSAHQEFHPY